MPTCSRIQAGDGRKCSWSFTNWIGVGSICGSAIPLGNGSCWPRWPTSGSRRRSSWWRSEGQPDRYLVIDGYKRLAALQQLGRDTVEAVVWPLSEAEALVLDRSLRFSDRRDRAGRRLAAGGVGAALRLWTGGVGAPL